MQMRTSKRPEQPISTRQMAFVALLAAVYVVLGQVVRFLPNPMVPGAIIALNMTVVVIAGLLLGPTAGALVGLIGTGANAISPAGNSFEVAAIIPHTVMGLVAGLARDRVPVLVGALSILVGHVLNILVFVWTGLLPLTDVTGAVFFGGLAFETVVDVVVIVIAVPLLRPLVKAA